jgi:hypothetical protein
VLETLVFLHKLSTKGRRVNFKERKKKKGRSVLFSLEELFIKIEEE